MTTIELPTQDYTLGNRLRLVLEGLVPVLLIVVIVSLVLFRVDVTKQFRQTALSVQSTACTAVRQSNNDLDAFLVRTLGGDADAVKFVSELKVDHAATYAKCLRTVGARP